MRLQIFDVHQQGGSHFWGNMFFFAIFVLFVVKTLFQEL